MAGDGVTSRISAVGVGGAGMNSRNKDAPCIVWNQKKELS